MTRQWVSVQKDRLAGIAFGGNSPSPLGSTAQTIVRAIGDISAEVGTIVSVSRFYRSPAYPSGSGPDFLNGVVLVETTFEPDEVLEALHRIEARYARTRTQRWAARTLDLDLVMHGDRILPDPETQLAWVSLDTERQKQEAPDRLILPHPRLQDRGFVLIPLAEVAPEWQHPVTGRTVAEMTDDIPEGEKAAICPL